MKRRLAISLAFLAAAVAQGSTLTGVNALGTDATGAAHTTARYWSSTGGGFVDYFVTPEFSVSSVQEPVSELLAGAGLVLLGIVKHRTGL